VQLVPPHTQANPAGDVCVEIGSGSGYVLCTAALLMDGRGACFAVDVNPLAAAATLTTMRAHGMHAEVRPASLPAELESAVRMLTAHTLSSVTLSRSRWWWVISSRGWSGG
jgi:methylase of polypeptide subunit release factors